MDLKLTGRRALVTGGSRGIGRGIVAALAAEGAQVVFCGRSAGAGEHTAAELRAAGMDVTFLQGDMVSDAGVDLLAETVLASGPIDILVNNVGGAHDAEAGARPFTDIPATDWPLTFAKCVFNAVRLCNAMVPTMQKRGWGRVINISSSAGMEPGMAPADYSAAKAALNTATQALAVSLTQTGVTANAVAPGPVLTEAMNEFMEFLAGQGGWPEGAEARETHFITHVMPLKTKRMGRPEDIGAMTAFLASDQAEFVTGALIRVDGGQSVSVN